MQNTEELNKSAWNSEVIKHNYWTKAVSQEQIERAKNKDLNIITTHMSVNSEKLLEKTIFRNNNVELAKDGKIFYIKTD